MKRSSRLRAFGVLGSAGLVAAALAAPSAASLAASSNPLVPVSQGVAADVLANATPTGQTAGSTMMRVSFILKMRNMGQLAGRVEAGWRGPYLTPAEFALDYGQTPEYVYALRGFLREFGITSQVMPDMLDITTQGTAAEYDKALGVLLENFTVTVRPAGAAGSPVTETVYGSRTNPRMPLNLAANILAILGLSNYAPYESLSVPGIKEATPQATAQQTAAPTSQLPQAYINDYNLTPLIQAGALGQGQTIGIVTLASVDPAVPNYFWEHVAQVATLPHRIHLVNVDGGAGPVSLNAGSDETTLDVEQSGTIAPMAKIVVYQAPNTDYGFVDAFYEAASQDVAGSVSASWGESETAIQAAVDSAQESPGYAASFNQAFLEMAAQGQSNFVASGDFGAYNPARDIGTTNLGIISPSDSPYDTAAGGTTLPGTQTYPIVVDGQPVGFESVAIPAQMTWGWDYLWPMYVALGFTNEAQAAESLPVGSGGGYSVLFGRPLYQQGQTVGAGNYSAYEFLTPIDPQQVAPGLVEPTQFSFDPTPSLMTGTSGGRVTPDLAFDADPQTGYVVYDPQFQSVYGSTLVDFGGTSFVAPQLNGTDAVYESALGGVRLGFWNPNIYRFATSSSSPFTPLDSNTVFGSSYYTGQIGNSQLTIQGEFTNTNDFYTGTSGAVFNPGSGLGYADLTALFRSFQAAIPRELGS
jgi:kumamolisin